MTRSKYFLFVLAFLTLFAQQGALLHELSHLPEELRLSRQQDQHPAHPDVCDECLAFSAITGGAMPSTALQFTASDVLPVYTHFIPQDVSSPPLLAYLSRAPPRLV